MATKQKILSYYLNNGKKGDTFYSTKKDKDITCFAVYNKVKVTTQKIIAIESDKIIHLVKITII